jgi:hypothetical protein
MQYKPKYFSLKECFPANHPHDWKYMDSRILKAADKLREVFGPLWCNGRGLTQCGFRTNGSKTSQHRFCRAMDLHSDNYDAETIRMYILGNRKLFSEITFLEVDISWLHIDCRNDDFTLWSPKRGFVSIENYLKIGDV